MAIASLVIAGLLAGENAPPISPFDPPYAVEASGAAPEATQPEPVVVAASRLATAGENAPAASAPSPATAAPPPHAAPADPGDIVVTGRTEAPPGDPLASVNEQSFEVIQSVDRAFVAPVTHAYERTVPRPLRRGIHNMLNNLDEPIVFVNFLLQFKIGKALDTFARFTINSTVGIAGIMDIARQHPFHLPRRSNGLADTMGYYGIGPGPFLFLPLIGSTTVRDVMGRMVDLSILPAIAKQPFGDPVVSLGKNTLSALDERSGFDDSLRELRDESADPYTTIKEAYLQRRREEIEVLKGLRPPIPDPGFEGENLKPRRDKSEAPAAPAQR